MNDYQIYINEINNIFNILEHLEKNSFSQDNINYIENLKEYKDTIVAFSKIINNKEQETTEVISND